MMIAMQALKARVKGGRLVLDEPTNLPEGEVIELVPLDEVLANGDDLDDEERARLHAALAESDDDIAANRVRPAADVLADLNRHL